MLNKKLLAVALSMVVSGVAFGDGISDTHTLTITVPEVTLLDIGAGGVTSAEDGTEAVAFDCTTTGVPAAAGANFTTCAPTNATFGYAITANNATNPDGTLILTRKITASLGATEYIDPTWNVSVEATPGTVAGVTDYTSAGTTTGVVRLPLTATAAATEVVTGIKNVVSTVGTMTYTLTPADAGAAMAYETSKVINVTYTIGTEGV
jgi:hypothetical protein